jgi:putative Mg2+ transporter-C (MgtC) family protein
MPLHPSWTDLLLRLALTVLAGIVVGLNRGGHGHAAGLRTTLLVCLAASVSMILMNLLLDQRGKAPDSFISNDLMRLPLGILSGVGFIGAGAILRRGSRVTGLTTAATLWIVTVIGLCLGGGQIQLGLIALAVTFVTLWGLGYLERFLTQDLQATLTLAVTGDGPGEKEIIAACAAEGFDARLGALSLKDQGRARTLTYHVTWRGRTEAWRHPTFLETVGRRPDVADLRWMPQVTPKT